MLKIDKLKKQYKNFTLAELQSEVLVCKIKFLGADLG